MTTALFAIAGAFFVGSMVVLDRMALKVVTTVPALPERSVPDLGVPHEDFTIPSGDHQLAAWLLRPGRQHPDEPLLLLAHGWGASYGTVLQLAEPLAELGHDVLLFDVRGHGRNRATDFVTIRDFRDDVVAVLRYAAERFPHRKLVLVGHSLGGAAGVVAAADGAPLDGLVLIASPSSVLMVTAEYLIDHGMPGNLMVRLFRPFWWRRIGGTFGPFTPSERIGELDLPILMIQPEHDHRVRRDHADRLAAAGGLDYHLIEGREHTDVLAAPETLRLVEEFLAEV